MNIGEKIHDRRIELGLTLDTVGNYCGVGKATVQRWETGAIANMRRDKIALLAKILQMSPVDLINTGTALSSETLTAEELALVTAYRAADDRARMDALNTLKLHPRDKKED